MTVHQLPWGAITLNLTATQVAALTRILNNHVEHNAQVDIETRVARELLIKLGE